MLITRPDIQVSLDESYYEEDEWKIISRLTYMIPHFVKLWIYRYLFWGGSFPEVEPYMIEGAYRKLTLIWQVYGKGLFGPMAVLYHAHPDAPLHCYVLDGTYLDVDDVRSRYGYALRPQFQPEKIWGYLICFQMDD
jgi:hypothetical protein